MAEARACLLHIHNLADTAVQAGIASLAEQNSCTGKGAETEAGELVATDDVAEDKTWKRQSRKQGSEVALADIVAENMIGFSHRQIHRLQDERPAFAGCSLGWRVQTETHNQKAVGRKTVEADLDLESWHGDWFSN